MKAHVIAPEAQPPGVRRLSYAIFCWANRRPLVWRFVAAVFRRWPFLSTLAPFAATHDAVTKVLKRPDSFSNTSHAPNLLAGSFMIGMEPGPQYKRDKALFDNVVPTPEEVRTLADREARRLVQEITHLSEGEFDLVEDYLMWIVLRSTETAFGYAAERIPAGKRGQPGEIELERQYLHELRHVAAQLFAGTVAPQQVLRRAEASALSLNKRIDSTMGILRGSWAGVAPDANREAITRSAVGLAWVSHPVTVQSGALLVQELLGRKQQHRNLRLQVHDLGTKVWSDPLFRKQVRDHVLELMRFRPVFPLLARDVPRDTSFEAGGRWRPQCPAGGSVTVLSIGAMFDAQAVTESGSYEPGRMWGAHEESRYLMFGYGDRRCPGREQALEMLTSALIGLLTLPTLTWSGPRASRLRYDGPMISKMSLRWR